MVSDERKKLMDMKRLHDEITLAQTGEPFDPFNIEYAPQTPLDDLRYKRIGSLQARWKRLQKKYPTQAPSDGDRAIEIENQRKWITDFIGGGEYKDWADELLERTKKGVTPPVDKWVMRMRSASNPNIQTPLGHKSAGLG